MAPDRRVDHVIGLATAADRSDFGSVWVTDTDPPLTHPASAGSEPLPLEALTLLGALSARTSRVKLGVAVLDVASWNPGILAKMVTTIDVLARGRALLGISTGRHDSGLVRCIDGDGECETRSGETGDPAGRDHDGAVEESVRICRSLFAGDDVSFVGRHFRLDRARNLPRPTQPGGPPILIGGADDRALPLVARYADKCGVVGTADEVAQTADLLQRRCEEAGRDPAQIEVSLFAPCILTSSDHPEPVAEDAAGRPARVPAGSLVGRPEQIPELVADYLAVGVDEVIFGLQSPVDAFGVTQLGEALGLRSPA